MLAGGDPQENMPNARRATLSLRTYVSTYVRTYAQKRDDEPSIDPVISAIL